MNIIEWLFDAQLHIGNQVVLWREVIGNVFGLASALGGMRRKLWAWPVGIIGNALLFTVFLGAVFHTPNPVNLLGQAGRQLMFIGVSIYGWYRWQKARGDSGSAVTPRWAGWRTRIILAAVLVGGTAAITPLFTALGSFQPVWADAWIFVGSLLATYGMAKGWTEFWLIWVAVDVVGVPLLISAGYYASAFMYVFYGVFTLVGFFVWGTHPPEGSRRGARHDLTLGYSPASSPCPMIVSMTERLDANPTLALQIATALWDLGLSDFSIVTDAAADCLANNMDTPSLRDLAGRSTNENWFEMKELLERTFGELDLRIPPTDAERSSLVGMAYVCREFLAGRLSPRELSNWAHTHLTHEGPPQAQGLVDLDDEFDEGLLEGDWRREAELRARAFLADANDPKRGER